MIRKHYGVLQSVVERKEALQINTGRYGSLRIAMERYGSVEEPLRNVMEHYRTVAENIDFAHH